jgi:multidrug efflux pump subunit AcrB
MTSRGRTSILVGTILLVGAAIAVCLIFRPRSEPIEEKSDAVTIQLAGYKAPLVIAVEASYPGANAQTVRDTVAAPIEQQISGVDNMLSMSSVSADDGSYALHITFADGTDLDLAQALVQKRVSLALAVIPDLVQGRGVTVRQMSPQPLLLVSLTSPDGRFDQIHLSNYAMIQIKDELGRLSGVADVVLFGRRDTDVRIALDADKLAAHELTAVDVVRAISEQNVQVAGLIGQSPAPKGQQLQLSINTLGRLVKPDEFEDIIVKAGPEGRVVRLKDVARVAMGHNAECDASLNGKPALVLGIHSRPNAKPSELSRAVFDKLAELRAPLLEGLALACPFDFAANLEDPNNPVTPEHLVIDAELPAGASVERTARTLERAAQLLRNMPGVLDVLALTEHPFSLVRNRPCLVVRLALKKELDISRKQLEQMVRVALKNQIPEAVFRVSAPSAAESFPVYGFPVEFVIEDRGDQGSEALRQRAEALSAKMNQSGKFLDASVGPGLRSSPSLYLDIDRTQCMVLGVQISDIFTTLQVYLGSYYVNNFNEFGRTWQVNVRADAKFRARGADILQLQVRNNQNQMVRLGKVLTVRDTGGPMAIERHNMYPSARISANLSEGVSHAEAKVLCETLAEQELGAQFNFVWPAR